MSVPKPRVGNGLASKRHIGVLTNTARALKHITARSSKSAFSLLSNDTENVKHLSFRVTKEKTGM